MSIFSSGFVDHANAGWSQGPRIDGQCDALAISNVDEVFFPSTVAQFGIRHEQVFAIAAGGGQVPDEPEWQALDGPARPCGGHLRHELRRDALRRPVAKPA